MRPIVYGGDRTAVRFNLGDVCVLSAIEKSIALKLKYFDFRMGSEAYKARFYPKIIPLKFLIVSRETDNMTGLLPKHWTIGRRENIAA